MQGTMKWGGPSGLCERAPAVHPSATPQLSAVASIPTAALRARTWHAQKHSVLLPSEGHTTCLTCYSVRQNLLLFLFVEALLLLLLFILLPFTAFSLPVFLFSLSFLQLFLWLFLVLQFLVLFYKSLGLMLFNVVITFPVAWDTCFFTQLMSLRCSLLTRSKTGAWLWQWIKSNLSWWIFHMSGEKESDDGYKPWIKAITWQKRNHWHKHSDF